MEEICGMLNREAPEGVIFTACRRVSENKSKAMALVAKADYTVFIEDGFLPETDFAPVLHNFMEKEAIVVHKVSKKTESDVDVRPMIYELSADPDGPVPAVCVQRTHTEKEKQVAEEAVRTAEFLGNDIIRIYDVGVAGIHRLFANLEQLLSAQVVIVIAGMEGALASVTGGLVSVPVIAVPTSVGYGASFEGLAALLSMLNSCASGVSVVNIDNGYGAAYQASQINHMSIFNKNRSKV
jgi:phosphoribosylcarboxyaminoimidazole (NCAIR) mutase